MANDKRQMTNDNKTLKVLFIGDIVGTVGREVVKKTLGKLKEAKNIDVVIANGEHLSERVGLDIELVREMHDAGINLFTTGNHVWRKRGFEEHIGKAEVPVIRPANFATDVPGEGYRILNTKKGKILVANLLGQENIEAKINLAGEISEAKISSPFDVADHILESVKGYKYSIFDFHAEMTSEKVALGQYLDGRIGSLVGTHTHVPTADARILPNGTAYVTDVGMTGQIESVLGVKSEIIIERFKSGTPQKFEVAEGAGVFNSVLLTFDERGKAKKIERIDKYLKA